jgi:membrane-associated phospholipid phosphatase
MDSLLDPGINLIVFIQSLGGWLEMPMRLFTFLGEEMFFILFMPALYWCISMDLGLHVGLILLVSNSLNSTLKLAFHGPRPYWYSTGVKPYVAETTFGVPSGHAQNAAAVWGMLASRLKRGWVWGVLLVVIFLIGFSRLYLAAHFPHDVVFGWLIGFGLLWLFSLLWNRVAAWVGRMQLHDQILFIFGASLGLILLSALALLPWGGWIMPAAWMQNATAAFPDEPPDPASLEGTVSMAAAFFGMMAGSVWLKRQGSFTAAGPLWQRVARYGVGLIGLLIIYFGLKLVFPADVSLVAYIFRYIRYGLVGVWVAALAPMLFIKIKLAQAQLV